MYAHYIGGITVQGMGESLTVLNPGTEQEAGIYEWQLRSKL
jgi:hypothetical protein